MFAREPVRTNRPVPWLETPVEVWGGGPWLFGERFAAWAPLPALLLAAWLTGHTLPPWVFMWLLAFAIYFGCKWLTWRQAERAGVPAWHSLAYLLAWPGMDARAFLRGKAPHPPVLTEWAASVLKMGAGAVLLWGLTPLTIGSHPLCAAWLATCGFILLAHFGLFQILSLLWRRAGVDAAPLMRAPLRANSLADFWSARWNTAFTKLTHDYVFRPLAPLAGVAGATTASFLVSGVVHDLLISVPAGGGYGLPTAYFMLQGIGVLLQRSKVARALRLSDGMGGWLVMLLFTAGPVYWLFHPLFMQIVLIPFLRVIHPT